MKFNLPLTHLHKLCFRCITASLAFFGILFSAYAQEEEELVSLSFGMLSWTTSIRDIVYMQGETPQTVLVPNGSPGRMRAYHGPKQLTFYREEAQPDATAVYRPIATTTLNSNQQEVLLLFIPDPGAESERYRIWQIPYDSSTFTENTFNFLNLTPRNLAIRLGGEDKIIPPGKNQIVRADTGDRDDEIVRIQIAATDDNNNWRPLYQSRWEAPGNRRIWVFVYGTDNQEPQIKMYYQRP